MSNNYFPCYRKLDFIQNYINCVFFLLLFICLFDFYHVCFYRLMGLSQSPVLCFVIDTTGSMSDDIDEAKRVSFEIIDRKRGTGEEPSGYILVPFNDPGRSFTG